MKNLRIVAFLVFAVCAFCLPAQAQKKWTYKSDNGAEGEITIIITQRPNGYEVSGDFKAGQFGYFCKLRGSYLPAGQRLRAMCVFSNGEKTWVTGSKQSGKDAFQVHVGSGGDFVAKRVGAKPATTGSSTESWTNLAGSWTAHWGNGTVIGAAAIEQQGSTITFYDLCCGLTTKANPHNKSKGHFQGSNTVIASDWGGAGTGQIKNNGTRIQWSNGTYRTR